MENNKIVNRILKKHKIENATWVSLKKTISQADLNTLLLDVYTELTESYEPSQLLTRYEQNNFVKPSSISPIAKNKLELKLLTLAEENGIEIVQLSPAALLGSCSAIGTVSQNKVISAIRGLEILADPTNMLAIHVCNEKKQKSIVTDMPVHLCATSHVVRGQKFARKDLLQHFNLFGIISSGRDKGSYTFEIDALKKHIAYYKAFFIKYYDAEISLQLSNRKGYVDHAGFIERVHRALNREHPNLQIEYNADEVNDNEYYMGLQFNIFVHLSKTKAKINIGDGGFVDWSQTLLGDKKERMLVSAIGLDRLIVSSNSTETNL